MQKNMDLIMGLICGVVMIFLNNNIVSQSILMVTTLFNPNDVNSLGFSIGTLLIRIITILSFIGIFSTIICVILMLKRIFKNR